MAKTRELSAALDTNQRVMVWIESAGSTPDPDQAWVIAFLERLRRAGNAWVFSEADAERRPDSSAELPGEPMFSACYKARRSLQPLPSGQARTSEEASPETGLELRSARQHVSLCKECTGWYYVGMPQFLDITPAQDKDWFCGRLRHALAPTGADSSAAFSGDTAVEDAVAEHALSCRECAAWLTAWRAVSACATIRPLLLERERENQDTSATFKYLPFPTKTNGEISHLLHRHVRGCLDCRDWCLRAVDCGIVQNNLKRLAAFNATDWKMWRHNIPGLLDSFHLHACAACRAFLVQNYENTWETNVLFAALNGPGEGVLYRSTSSDPWNPSETDDVTSETDDVTEVRFEPAPSAATAWLDNPVWFSEMEWSIRTWNCLRRNLIRTTHQLTQKTVPQLMALRNFGRKSLLEVRTRLAALGLRLRDDEEAGVEGSNISEDVRHAPSAYSLRSLYDLGDVINGLSRLTFQGYVNGGENKFADWIRQELRLPSLAQALQHDPTRLGMMIRIEEHLGIEEHLRSSNPGEGEKPPS